MSLVSTRCLVVLLILFPFPTRSDRTPGFPELDNKDKIKAALQNIHKEDFFPGGDILNVEDLIPFDSIKYEVRLRNGYKSFGEGCSSDPASNQHLFSPPGIIDLAGYPIWQRHLLDANRPLCSPFKHIRCSKTTGKCESRPGLIWREKVFENHEILFGTNLSVTVQALREREKICTVAMNKPCQMREYPGDEEIDSKALSPSPIREAIRVAAMYLDILHRVGTFGIPSLRSMAFFFSNFRIWNDFL